MNKDTPAKISMDFLPSDRLYELARRDGISKPFIDELVNGFIFYWGEQEARKTLKNWNSTFWNNVKRQWGYKLAEEKKTKTRCSVPFREMEKVEKSKSTMTLKQRLRGG